MKKMINQITISGYLFNSDLDLREVTNKDSENFGKKYIRGTVNVVVDEEGLNVVPVNYTYEPEVNKNGKPNSKFSALKTIMETENTWENAGTNALKVSINSAIDLNEFWSDRDGRVISSQRSESGFISFPRQFGKERNDFTVDIVLTSVELVEADVEKGYPEKMKMQGFIFNFRKEMLPVTFTLKDPDGIRYFNTVLVDADHPYFTKAWGKLNSITGIRKIEEKTAFGAPAVREVRRTTKEWVINTIAQEPYVLGTAETLTSEEVTQMQQDREVKKAKIKADFEAYQKTRNTPQAPQGGFGGPGAAIAAAGGISATNTGGFKF